MIKQGFQLVQELSDFEEANQASASRARNADTNVTTADTRRSSRRTSTMLPRILSPSESELELLLQVQAETIYIFKNVDRLENWMPPFYLCCASIAFASLLKGTFSPQDELDRNTMVGMVVLTASPLIVSVVMGVFTLYHTRKPRVRLMRIVKDLDKQVKAEWLASLKTRFGNRVR